MTNELGNFPLESRVFVQPMDYEWVIVKITGTNDDESIVVGQLLYSGGIPGYVEGERIELPAHTEAHAELTVDTVLATMPVTDPTDGPRVDTLPDEIAKGDYVIHKGEPVQVASCVWDAEEEMFTVYIAGGGSISLRPDQRIPAIRLVGHLISQAKARLT